MTILRVTCAIILNQHQRVLVTQRNATMKLPLKWEFPGGKIEPGETEEACLIREIKEELLIDIQLQERLPSNLHHYETFSLELIPFTAIIISGTIQLKEHAQYVWSDRSQLSALDWAAADIPILDYFLTHSLTNFPAP